MILQIIKYESKMQNALLIFFKKTFKEDQRYLSLDEKDKDLCDIKGSYLDNGCFWCIVDQNEKIYGTIALRNLGDFFEIRRLFVLKKFQNKGYGKKLITLAIEYAIKQNASQLKIAVMERGTAVQHLMDVFEFSPTKQYNNSSADIFFKRDLTPDYIYNFKLKQLSQAFENSIILNPTENIPFYNKMYDTRFFEGLYVSERLKDINDKVIFAGRNDYIEFFEYIKQEWKKRLNAYDVDLKTLAGLNAHLILFLCILSPGDTVMLLPEICGGHFSTEQILRNLGAKVVQMVPDKKKLRVDKQQTRLLIKETKPNYIFVDRSEGLLYEDFSWLKDYTDIYKIFDASQYLTQILLEHYISPFDMGFDMIVSTLHKNYPGPQKGIIAVKKDEEIWENYQRDAKTYISNTHPMHIANSIIPLLNEEEFISYSSLNIECSRLLEEYLLQMKVPVVQSSGAEPRTLHVWILCDDKELSYKYYLKLQTLHILCNYRQLPYDLGFGLRVGTSAAVRMGLRPADVKELATIMANAYHGPVTPSIIKRANKLIQTVKKSAL